MTTHGASDADVIVVGAGPGGAASAYHLARRGLDVLLLEKTRFPREKVCGDGLTPRSVAALLRMRLGWKVLVPVSLVWLMALAAINIGGGAEQTQATRVAFVGVASLGVALLIMICAAKLNRWSPVRIATEFVQR